MRTDEGVEVEVVRRTRFTGASEGTVRCAPPVPPSGHSSRKRESDGGSFRSV